MIGNNLRRAIVPATRLGVRNWGFQGAVTSGPPNNRISFTEKLCHFAAIVVGITAIPVWVLVHLEEYKKE